LEGGGHGLFQDIVPAFIWKRLRKTSKALGQPVTQPICKLDISWIQF